MPRQQHARIEAKKECKKDDYECADAAACDPARDAKASAIFNVPALVFLIETHKRSPFAVEIQRTTFELSTLSMVELISKCSKEASATGCSNTVLLLQSGLVRIRVQRAGNPKGGK